MLRTLFSHMFVKSCGKRHALHGFIRINISLKISLVKNIPGSITKKTQSSFKYAQARSNLCRDILSLHFLVSITHVIA